MTEQAYGAKWKELALAEGHFPRHKYTKLKLPQVSAEALSKTFKALTKPKTKRAIAYMTGISENQTLNALRFLEQQGKVVREFDADKKQNWPDLWRKA